MTTLSLSLKCRNRNRVSNLLRLMQFAMVSIRVWLAQYMRYRGISQMPIVINIPIKTSISAAVVAKLEYKLCVAFRFVSNAMWERSCAVKYMRKYSIGLRTDGISSSASEKFYGITPMQDNSSDYLPVKGSVFGLNGCRRHVYDFLLASVEASSSSITSSSLELLDC
ncbi:hypothetical protein T4E_6380 [Trichinella pseudospiralis]|uniref:Uncharacterized protein n=1 Tax=Trichinella pseudospiralis TaxID=6337 RepID=A0A0V0Y308_TRIPS|nr:hypothetical protein T4E_8309 [Trichinella pseudospiralis]KRX94726.1 hypothetical protein T4E_36 [Trichinella pseudospiralis]KRY00142.1 hypothetical protein T4E_6380 [Trichinella pseudospiralis]